jgi:RNA polymerase sigma-70 factor, ECF subfamily
MNGQETAWVRGAQRGDAGAFDRLVRANERRTLHAIAGVLGRVPEVYDVYQDTLVSAFTKLPSFRFESSFSTWLTRIAINRALNERRRRRPERNQPLEFASHVESGRSERASVRVESGELAHMTERAMGTLSGRERAVFSLKHQHGYKLKEIGSMLGCAEGTVKNYLFRATRKLRKQLEPAYRDLD